MTDLTTHGKFVLIIAAGSRLSNMSLPALVGPLSEARCRIGSPSCRPMAVSRGVTADDAGNRA